MADEHTENMKHGVADLPHRLPDTLPIPTSITDTYLAAILIELRQHHRPAPPPVVPPREDEIHVQEVEHVEEPEEEAAESPKHRRHIGKKR